MQTDYSAILQWIYLFNSLALIHLAFRQVMKRRKGRQLDQQIQAASTGQWIGAAPDALVRHSAQVIEAVRKAQVGRLIVVGGCGSLWISPGVKVVDSDKWPAQFVPVAQSHMKLLAALRSCGLNWTYVSPPMLIDLGERTGKYRTGLDDLVVDEAGKSWVSFEDYAIALVDELEHPRHERERFSVGY
jgi:putative NADH-flavin reductase